MEGQTEGQMKVTQGERTLLARKERKGLVQQDRLRVRERRCLNAEERTGRESREGEGVNSWSALRPCSIFDGLLCCCLRRRSCVCIPSASLSPDHGPSTGPISLTSLYVCGPSVRPLLVSGQSCLSLAPSLSVFSLCVTQQAQAISSAPS